MSDSFTEVTSQGYFSRIKNSLKGIVTGFVLIIISFGLLWWNEGRSVKTAKGLEEGAENVVAVQADNVEPNNEGKLVHLTGMLVTNDTLSDEEFNIKVNAIRLERNVEMYQWVEHKKEKKEKKLGGKEETVTTYTYSKEWKNTVINSGNFRKPEGHQNIGEFPISSTLSYASNVTMGAYSLNGGLIAKLNDDVAYSDFQFNEQEKMGYKASVSGGTIFLTKESVSNPKIGDLRISYSVVYPGEYSIISKQLGNSFEPYITEQETSIQMIEAGIIPADKMFEAAQKRNTLIAWGLRGLGLLLMFMGFKALMNPLVILADVIPFVGSIVGAGTAIVAFLVALVLSLITIAIAWIFYRPILGISLIAIAIGAIFLLKSKSSKDKRVKELYRS